MTEQEFTEAMIAKLEAALLASPAAEMVTIGDVTIRYADAEARLTRLRRRHNEIAGSKPKAANVRLDGDR